MSVIRCTHANRAARDAVSLDFGDLAREGEAMRIEAAKSAAKVVEEAQAIRKSLLESARKEGFEVGRAAGYRDGLAAGREEGHVAAMAEHAELLSNLEKAWTEALKDVERERASGVESLRTDGIRLAIEIAERIVRGVIAIDPSRVVAIAEAAIDAAARSSDLRILHHPDDAGLLAEAMPEMVSQFGGSRRIELVADASVGAGSVRVRSSGGGGVDASVDTQLARIAECLLPDSEARPERPA